jgi:predicted dehydrogenase
MDVGCYCVSALRLLCGEPARVSAEQVLGGDGVDVRFAGLLRFDGDVIATFDCGMDVHRHQGIQIVGSEASIHVPQPWQTWEGPKILVVRDEVETIQPPGVDPYAAELDEMAAAIAGERPPRLGREESVAQARTIQALYEAAEAGRSVTV